MTSSEGNTGPYLQYAHARLCSMEDKTSDIPLECEKLKFDCLLYFDTNATYWFIGEMSILVN